MATIEANKLCIHHVGGRSGTRQFPVLDAFEPGLLSVLYEADESCVAQIIERTAALPSENVVLPYCLGEREGEGELYLTGDPYLTSLLRPLTPPPTWATFNDFGWDTTQDAFTVKRTVPVKLHSLDQLIARQEVIPPAFLSLDTQGSELAILRGAAEALRSSAVAVQSEVGLVAYYEGQPLYHEVAGYLESHGFLLASLQIAKTTGGNYATPIGQRGRLFEHSGDALFFKRPEVVVATHPRPDEGLAHLAFCAFIHGFYDLAMVAVGLAGDGAFTGLADDPLVPPHLRFVAHLAAEAKDPRQLSFIRDDEMFPGDSGQHRFYTAEQRQGLESLTVAQLRDRYFQRVDPRAFMQAVPRFATAGHVGIEAVAVRFGLLDHARDLRDLRLNQVVRTLNRLGLATLTGGNLNVDLEPVVALMRERG